MADVSVIIVTWNSAEYIGPCLESLHRHSGHHELEIIVADNGSTDDTCAIATAAAPDAVVLQLGANLGFPCANNRAVARARGRYLFFLNPDTHLDNDAIGLLQGHLEVRQNRGLVGPCIVSDDGTSIAVDARSFPSLKNTAYRYFGLRSLFPHHPVFGSEYLHPAMRQEPREVDCLTGAALFVEADFFRMLGGFDEALPMYFEDMDLCSKAHAAGHGCLFVPEARVTHYGGRSTAHSPIARFLLALEDGQAPWMYFRKYRGPGKARCFTVILAAGNLFRLLLYVLASPLILHSGFRLMLYNRVAGALTLLRWCASSKTACAATARRLFETAPESDASACIPHE